LKKTMYRVIFKASSFSGSKKRGGNCHVSWTM
jgi:hypothetical protein